MYKNLVIACVCIIFSTGCENNPAQVVDKTAQKNDYSIDSDMISLDNPDSNSVDEANDIFIDAEQDEESDIFTDSNEKDDIIVDEDIFSDPENDIEYSDEFTEDIPDNDDTDEVIIDTETTDQDTVVATCPEGAYHLSNFCVVISGDAKYGIEVTYVDDPEHIMFETKEDEPFLHARLVSAEFKESSGSFKIKEDLKDSCDTPIVSAVSQNGDSLTLSGNFGENCKIDFTFTLKPSDDKKLQFIAELEPFDKPDNSQQVWRAIVRYHSYSDEKLYGFGEQYTYLNMKGRRLPIFCQEQGHGRGLEPMSSVVNTLAGGSAGYWHTTYAGVPYYISNYPRSIFLENYEYSIFDMTEDNLIEIEVNSNTVTGNIIYGSNMLDIIEQYTEYAGRMKPLPEWMGSGAILGFMGGSEVIRNKVQLMEDAGVPISVLWLQDWSGVRVEMGYTRMWWNWEIDYDLYPDWEELTQSYMDKGIKIMTYINPFLADASEKENARDNYKQIAMDNNYLMLGLDGKPVEITNGGFSVSIIDLSNPAAYDWYKTIIKEKFIDKGYSGWMADFGEAINMNISPYNGENPQTFHHRYIELWNKLNNEVIEETGTFNDVIPFMRAGYTRSPGKLRLFWAGDQLTTWDEHDGIKTTITALISSGLSGFSINHSDIGGIIQVDLPLARYVRSKELMLRWTELNAFTPLYRTHEGNTPDKGHQIFDDQETIEFFGYFGKVFAALNPYRMELMKEAHAKGYPMVRPLMLHYPEDLEVYDIMYQFMLGSDFLVAPVVDKETDKTDIYLPKGKWVYIWDQSVHGSTEQGVRVLDFDAPIGKPPVFYKKGSKWGDEFIQTLKDQNLID